MKLQFLTTSVAVSFFLCASHGSQATRTGFSRRQGDSKRVDLSWIKKWAAVGDSYAAGIRAGERINYLCSRYDHSYPSVINANDQLSGKQVFDFKACSGATSSIVQKQVSSLGGDQDAITISSGGNDIGLVNLLNECIYTWRPARGCAATIADSKTKIENELPNNLDSLYAAAQRKLSGIGSVYVTAYARFFDDTSTDCDGVSWHWYPRPLGILNYQYLTVQRRKDMNELVDMVNLKIKEAVARAGTQFVLVEYDAYIDRLKGRYCLPGIQEPSPNRADLLFYLDGTKEAPEKKRRQTDDPNAFPPDTFEGEIASLIAAGSQNLTEETTDPKLLSLLAIPVSDNWARVFHPLQLGHSIIEGKVLYHMSTTASKLANKEPGPEVVVVAADACPLTSRPLPIPPDKTASCGAELGLNFPKEFVLSDAKAPVSEILYRMRDQACQGLCEKVAGVPDNFVAAQSQGTNGCEYAVKISARKEAYLYSTGSGQNCYDATERMINSCMVNLGDGKAIHEAGWLNGPNYGEFFQVGVRDLNGKGSIHPPLTTTDSDHLGHIHVACRRSDKIVADGYQVDISNWDDGNWGKSIQSAVKDCNLVLTGWQYEPGTKLRFTDGTLADHWASFSLPLSNGGCAESRIKKALGLIGGGLNCPFEGFFELDMFK